MARTSVAAGAPADTAPTSGDSPKRGRPRRGPDPERYAQILDAAAGLFLEKGYDATSMQDVADRVGLLKGSLYYYVRSKEDLLFHIMEPAYQEALDRIEPIARATDQNPTDRIDTFVHAHVDYAIANIRAFRIRLREFRQLTGDRRDYVHQVGQTYLTTLRTILTDGQQQGYFAKDLDIRVTAQAVIGLLNSVTEWFHEEGRLGRRQVADQLSRLIIRSLAPASATKS